MNFIAALRKTVESIKIWVENRKTSWNDLTDKPFGKGEDIVIEWDGETALDGHDIASMFYKVSNLTPSKTDFEGMTTYHNNGAYGTPTEDGYVENVVLMFGGQAGMIVYDTEQASAVLDGVPIPSKGIYFAKNEEYIAELVLHGKVTPIDSEYLPTFDVNLTDDGGAYTADKTIAEIREAIRKGENVRMFTESDGETFVFYPTALGFNPTFVSITQVDGDDYFVVETLAYRPEDDRWVNKNYSLKNV